MLFRASHGKMMTSYGNYKMNVDHKCLGKSVSNIKNPVLGAVVDTPRSPTKKFRCEVCNKCFSHTTTLQDHLNIHTKQKPHRCPFSDCNKAFSNRSNLSRHLRIHTGVKPYTCHICNKSFSQSSNLKAHVKIHNR